MADCTLRYRVIENIRTINDGRPNNVKPHANELILSFWGLYLGRINPSLRSLFFAEVEEPSMEEAKRYVYEAMGNISEEQMWIPVPADQRLSIRAGRSDTETTLLNYLCTRTPLGQVGQRIVEQNEDMIQAQLIVVEAIFIPTGDDVNFHFNILLG